MVPYFTFKKNKKLHCFSLSTTSCLGVAAAQAAAGGAGALQAAATGRQTEEDPTAARAAAEVRGCECCSFHTFLLGSRGASTSVSRKYNISEEEILPHKKP